MQDKTSKLDKTYKPLTLPKLQWETVDSTGTYSELVVHPLEPGFGVTLGNALRRVALSSVEGSAVTSVIIKGVNNEFSTLPGVVEDVLQIILNIRGIIIKNSTGKPGKMVATKKGKSVMTAADISADENLEIINKDHVIAHLADNGELSIEFFVESGRGYVPAQWSQGEKLQADDRVFVDAFFSPVRRIEFRVEKTRVGKSIDYDKLHFNIYTNGAVEPAEVIYYATSVLRTQLEFFLEAPEIPLNEISRSEIEKHESEKRSGEKSFIKDVSVDFLLKPIDELEFPVRAHNCLISAGVKRVIDLVNRAEEDLLKIKNFGRKSLREVKEILSAFNLHLGMNIKELDLKKMLKEQEESAKL